MIIGEYCGCEMCEYISKMPKPRNRMEQRLWYKEVKMVVKKLHYFHMMNRIIEDIIGDESEIHELECCCETNPIQPN